MKTEFTDAAIANIATKTLYSGSVLSGFGGWLLSSQGVGFVGICLAIAGFGVNWYYRHKQDSRESKLHEAQMKELQKE